MSTRIEFSVHRHATDDILPGAYSVTSPIFSDAFKRLGTYSFFWFLSHFISSSLFTLFLRGGPLLFLFLPALDFEHVQQQSRFLDIARLRLFLLATFAQYRFQVGGGRRAHSRSQRRPDGTAETCLARACLSTQRFNLPHSTACAISKRITAGSRLSITNQRTKNGRNSHAYIPIVFRPGGATIG